MDLVSVIIPVYNSEKYIEKCIESILNQSYSNIEIVLVDDGSTDNSREVISNFEEGAKIRCIHQKNNGAAAARNTGIKNANGKYIVFVDADDTCEQEHIENLVRAHKADNTLVICGYNRVFENKIVKISPGNKTYSKETISELVNAWTMDPIVGSPCNKLIEKNLLMENNIEYPEGIKYAEDFIFSIRLIKHCNKIETLEECTYNYNMTTPDSLSKINTVDAKKLWEDQVLVYREVEDVIKEDVADKLLAYMLVLNFLTRFRNNLMDATLIEDNKEVIRHVKNIRARNISFKLNMYYILFRHYCLCRLKILTRIEELVLKMIAMKS